jgi:ABC-2 type transport system ATP-binding protein
MPRSSSVTIGRAAPAVRVEDLRKRYGKLDAVRGITFDVERGRIFGLIGPDGAGKTTTFHCLAGVMEPGAGRVRVLDQPVRAARPSIGYLTQQFSLHLDLSVDENIRYAAGLRRVPHTVAKERKLRYLGGMGLARFGDRLARALSGGMKQKLALSCALISAPEVLLLDEPTTGIDPISRRELWDILTELAQSGVTIVIATPYLDEAERCDRVALMYDGRIEQIGTPDELRDGLGLQRLQIYADGSLQALESTLRRASGDAPAFPDVQVFGDRLDVLVAHPEQDEQRIRALLADSSAGSPRIERTRPTLENVFIADLRRHGSLPPHLGFTRAMYSKRDDRSGAAIEARQLCKTFGSFRAVRNVDLSVRYGEIYGLLGENGAGKTTTIKMLCGLTGASSGTIRIAGVHGNLRDPALRRRIGYMSQKFTLYNDLTIRENLSFYCGVYGIPPDLHRQKIDWVLASTGLRGSENHLTGNLPGGWKQRVAFGACVLHEPEILFLDEPTSGVDPLGRREFWRLISEFAIGGAAVLITTHYLDEAEHCNRVGFMAAGAFVAEGSPSEIKASQAGAVVELSVDEPGKARALLSERFGRRRTSFFGDRLHLALDDPGADFPIARALLSEHGIAIRESRVIPYSLEDAFINVVSRAGTN